MIQIEERIGACRRRRFGRVARVAGLAMLAAAPVAAVAQAR